MSLLLSEKQSYLFQKPLYHIIFYVIYNMLKCQKHVKKLKNFFLIVTKRLMESNNWWTRSLCKTGNGKKLLRNNNFFTCSKSIHNLYLLIYSKKNLDTFFFVKRIDVSFCYLICYVNKVGLLYCSCEIEETNDREFTQRTRKSILTL